MVNTFFCLYLDEGTFISVEFLFHVFNQLALVTFSTLANLFSEAGEASSTDLVLLCCICEALSIKSNARVLKVFLGLRRQVPKDDPVAPQ